MWLQSPKLKISQYKYSGNINDHVTVYCALSHTMDKIRCQKNSLTCTSFAFVPCIFGLNQCSLNEYFGANNKCMKDVWRDCKFIPWCIWVFVISASILNTVWLDKDIDWFSKPSTIRKNRLHRWIPTYF